MATEISALRAGNPSRTGLRKKSVKSARKCLSIVLSCQPHP